MRRNARRLILILTTGIFLLCGALLFGGVTASYIRKFNRTLEEENRIRMAETGENIRTYMNAVIDNNRSLLLNAAVALAAVREENRMSYLEKMQEQDHFVYIGYAETDGLLYTTLSSEARDISEDSYFKEALTGDYAVTGIVREILKDSAVSGVILAVPIPEGQGVVTAMIDLRQLEVALETSNFGGQGYSYIIDKEGSLVLYKRSMDYYNFFNLLDNVTFETGFSHDAILKDIREGNAGLSCYANFDVKQYAYYCPLGLNDWTAVNIVAKDVVTQKTDALVYELTGLCIVSVAVFLLLAAIVVILFNQSQNRKRADKAKSTFLANMSHDIRTPMNAIIGMTAIAFKHLDDPGQVKKCLNRIESSSQYLLGLINDVLDMSKIESGKMTLHNEYVPLPEVISRMITIVQPSIKSKKQKFSIQLHHVEHEHICTDSLRLSQVFINILSNASKFTPEGGKITVDIEELQQNSPETANYRFSFSDTGIGMSPEFVKDIFSSFSREQDSRKNGIEGTGQGMAISKCIVDAMHGTILVKSHQGKGTVFTVELEFQLDRNEPDPVPIPVLRVLIVTDDRNCRDYTSGILNSLGMNTECADTTEEAAVKLKETKNSNKAYDLLIMDARSTGTDMRQYVGEIRTAIGQDIPVLFICAYDCDEIESQVFTDRLNAFVREPLFRSKLCKKLRSLIGQDSNTENMDSGNKEFDFTGLRFLLVEDNELNREIAAMLFSDTGAVVEMACNGEEGLHHFEEAPAGYYALILMDIQMPVMDGYTATRKIRRLKRPDASTIPIIAMTANAFAEDVAACMEVGMNAHLSKPLDMQIVQETIQSFTHKNA